MLQPDSFSLPKEFEGFVSTADSLMEQFKRLDIEDEVTLSIYPDTKLSQAELIDLLQRLTAFIDKISESFIWFKDSLTVALIVPDSPNKLAHYCGKVKFADSIEDEWFIVYIALKLSESFPNTSTTVTDTDGQFLLIEAADFIPDWIDPENSEGRLWIRRGQLHIVPLDEAGRNIHDNGIKIEVALDVIQNRPNDTLAKKEVQSAIFQRTTSVYPYKAAAGAHTTHCTVSSTIAKLLTRCPELVSAAVNSFCMPAASGSNKNYIAAMQKFGPELTDLETVPVILTRLQYAKVVYQNFHVPKKFHGASRIVGGTECRKLTKSFDIGCRLTCGFEAIYQRAKSERASNVKTRLRDTNGNIESKVFYSDTHKHELDLCTVIDSILENKYMDHREEAQTDNNINDDNKSFSETKRSRNLLEAYIKICDKIPGDSDSWMYLSPEELDLEMESRVKKIQKENLKSATDTNNISANTIALDSIVDERYSKNNTKNKKDSENKNAGENPSSDHLMKMLEGMKSFLGTKSGPDGIEGIQNSASHIKSGKANQTNNADTSIKTINENKFEGVSEFNDTPSINKTMKMVGTTKNICDDETPHEFNFDFDKFKEILKKFGENDDGCETRNQPSNLSSDPSSNPLGDYFYERDLEELSSDDDSDYDSDDEVDYDKKSSRIEPVQCETNKQNKRENSKNLDEAVVISKESDKENDENKISMAIIGMKNIKIDSKPVKGSKIGTRPKLDGRAKYDSTVASLTPSSTIKASLAGSDINSCKTSDCAEVNTNFNNVNLQGIHDNIHTTTNSSSNPYTNPKDSKNNNDNDILRKDNDDDDDNDDDGTDSFYDESETDSDDEIEIRPTARTNHVRATSSSQNNTHDLRSLEEEDGKIDEDYDEINEGKYFEEYENTMDLELANSTLVESFERFSKDPETADMHADTNDESRRSGIEDSKEPEAVNVDLNFLKYLLESHASQLGSAGPATQLFSQLGVHLPHLPPMNSDPESDVQ